MANACGLVMMNKQVQSFGMKSSVVMRSIKNGRGKNSTLMVCNKKNNYSYTSMGVAMEEKRVQIPSMKSIDDKVSVGRMVKGGLVYSQNLTIRSFDIGFDRKLSLTALMSYLQDTALNHGTMMGILAEGEDLGITKEMCRNDLIWVVSSLQLQLHRCPSWLDVVKVETWMYPLGQNGSGHDWIIRDAITGHTLARATSVFVLMNKKSRKLSKMTKEIREELAPHMMDCSPILDKDTHKFPKLDIHTTDFVSTGLKPGWNDIDKNQHVNNSKYINWILESIPRSLMKHHQLSAVSLKFRRECNVDNELYSLSKIVTSVNPNNQNVELEHLLRLDNGSEIVGGSTIWKPRYPINNFNNTYNNESLLAME